MVIRTIHEHRCRGGGQRRRATGGYPLYLRTLLSDGFEFDPRANKQPVLALTSREIEVARLVSKGLSNPEIAAELYISRKAVEYHLGNIYAKCGLPGRQQLRRFVGQWHQPATV
jgi:DNA-binding NarL/FixJ family response regulator